MLALDGNFYAQWVILIAFLSKLSPLVYLHA